MKNNFNYLGMISSPIFFQLNEEETLFEHIFERYVQLEDNRDDLKQDLGIQNRNSNQIEINIEPSDDQQQERSVSMCSKSKQRNKKDSRRGRKYGKKEKILDLGSDIEGQRSDNRSVSIVKNTFNFLIDQSLTSLNSSKDNNNSTTGYVLWSITPFFIKWLLYEPTAEVFRSGRSNCLLKRSSIEILEEKERSSSQLEDTPYIEIPPLLNLRPIFNDGSNREDPKICVIELGSGVSAILPMVLGNYVDYYIGTDQNGILNKLKYNIRENLSEVTLRDIYSKTLKINQYDERISVLDENDKHDEISDMKKPKLYLEIESIDWETFKLDNKSVSKLYPSLETIKRIETKTVYMLAMDVIYNDFLIKPFLNTIKQLRDYYLEDDRNGSVKVVILIGVHLRSQEVVSTFLEQAIGEETWNVYSIDTLEWKKSRFNLYMIK